MLWRAMPLPYRVLIIVAVLAAFFSAGHRWSSNTWAVRYADREAELLRATATQVAWARALEHSLFRQSLDREAAYLQGARDAQAASLPKPPVGCPQPPPPPPAVMQERTPNYGERLRAILFDSPTSATSSSSN
jgi:hypothetical protein